VQRATARSKTGTFRDYGVTEAPSGFRAGWSDCMNFFSLSVHFDCSSGVNAAQTFVRRFNHENFEREINFAYVFLSLDSIPSQFYRHHYALSSICRPQVYGRRRRRTKWPISTPEIAFNSRSWVWRTAIRRKRSHETCTSASWGYGHGPTLWDLFSPPLFSPQSSRTANTKKSSLRQYLKRGRTKVQIKVPATTSCHFLSSAFRLASSWLHDPIKER
jgi:hypothetical protein